MSVPPVCRWVTVLPTNKHHHSCISFSSSTCFIAQRPTFSCKYFCVVLRSPCDPPWETSGLVSVFWLASTPEAKRARASARWAARHAVAHTYTHMHRKAYARAQTFLLMRAHVRTTRVWHLDELKLFKRVDWRSNGGMRPGRSVRGERCGLRQVFG